MQWDDAAFDYTADGGPDGDPDPTDSAPFMSALDRHQPVLRLGRRPAAAHPVARDRSSTRPTSRASPCATPTSRPSSAGTYAGLASEPIIDHLVRLGVTAVELMPVHQFVHDRRLVDLGLRNYWGYNSIAFFAPHNDYASYGQRRPAGVASSSRW